MNSKQLEHRYERAKRGQFRFRPDWTSTIHCPECGRSTKEMEFVGEYGGMQINVVYHCTCCGHDVRYTA